MSEAVLGRVCNLMRENLDLQIARFSRATPFATYGMRASEIDGLLCDCEAEFDLDLGDVDENSLHTVGELVDLIEARLSEAAQ